jgi:hypothetical protein
MADSGGPSSARMRIRKAGSNSMVLKAPVPHSIAHCLHAVEARKQSSREDGLPLTCGPG